MKNIAWVDVPTEAALRIMQEAVARACAKVGRQAYALLDMSFADAPPPLSGLAEPERVHSLYKDRYSAEGLERVDPLLIELGPEPSRAIADLAQWCAARPMLSVIVSPLKADRLLEHLRAQTVATDSTGERYLLRWADTRCLPMLHEVFDAEQNGRLLRGIDVWWHFDRMGEARVISDAPDLPAKKRNAALAGLEKPYRLSTAQKDRLLALSLPDTVLSFIADRPHLYGRLRGAVSARHRAVSHALAAQENGAHQAESLRLAIGALDADGLLET
ncbi:MAG: DUF4123 domain-containing protein [Zoogloeaceae bacterium]|jgi:hypothetical protein|nr:DUF4123 domain-containing protein [Zoogloeaceae bacterium]